MELALLPKSAVFRDQPLGVLRSTLPSRRVRGAQGPKGSSSFEWQLPCSAERRAFGLRPGGFLPLQSAEAAFNRRLRAA